MHGTNNLPEENKRTWKTKTLYKRNSQNEENLLKLNCDHMRISATNIINFSVMTTDDFAIIIWAKNRCV